MNSGADLLFLGSFNGEMMIDPTFRQTWTHVMLEIAMVHTHIWVGKHAFNALTLKCRTIMEPLFTAWIPSSLEETLSPIGLFSDGRPPNW